MPLPQASDPTLFKRPYTARRQRHAAKRRPASPVSKLLLRVLTVLLVLLAATLAIIFKDTKERSMASGAPQGVEAPPPR